MEILKKVLVFLDPKHDIDLREELSCAQGMHYYYYHYTISMTVIVVITIMEDGMEKEMETDFLAMFKQLRPVETAERGEARCNVPAHLRVSAHPRIPVPGLADSLLPCYYWMHCCRYLQMILLQVLLRHRVSAGPELRLETCNCSCHSRCLLACLLLGLPPSLFGQVTRTRFIQFFTGCSTILMP